MQVLALTPEQIATLPDAEKAAIYNLVSALFLINASRPSISEQIVMLIFIMLGSYRRLN